MFRNSNVNSNLLENLPQEIKEYIITKLPESKNQDILTTYRLSCVNQSFFKSFQPLLYQLAAKKLLQHILRNEENEIFHYIATHPHFLFIQTSAIDYAGRKVEASPYQAIIGTQNINLHNKVLPLIAQIPNGFQKAIHQYDEKFLDININPSPSEGFANDLKNFAEILLKEKFLGKKINRNTDTALKKIRDVLKTDIIEANIYFNLQLLTLARSIYDAYFKQWKVNQKSFYWVKIIGFLQRFIPACHIQMICPKKQIQDENIIRPFFPLDPALGEEFAVFNNKKSLWELPKLTQSGNNDWGLYVKKNSQEFKKIKPSLEHLLNSKDKSLNLSSR